VSRIAGYARFLSCVFLRIVLLTLVNDRKFVLISVNFVILSLSLLTHLLHVLPPCDLKMPGMVIIGNATYEALLRGHCIWKLWVANFMCV